VELTSICILLVEDNGDDVEIVRRMLGKYRRVVFSIQTAGTGRECLEALALVPVDLILLDHGLPDINGIALLRQLNIRAGAPPVIMLTGQGDERVAREAIREGAHDYFPKDSITSELLGHAIHQTVQRLRVEQELIDEQLGGVEQVIVALASAAEAKDAATEQHLHRMATYAVELGKALHLDERQLLLLRYGALLHDIGKIGVSETVLQKRGPLTPDEWREMRQHPIIGERICAPLRLAHDLRPIVRHHHEHWDGSGYADGLAGTEIPYLARIVAVVDAFDAMTTDRPYRDAFALDLALAQLGAGSGTQFDPSVAKTFVDLVRSTGPAFVTRATRLAA
jgi:putative two-component system response regulator